MSKAERPQIVQIIVVEGLHDKQAVDNAVQAEVWVLGGDRLAGHLLGELKRAAAWRGVLILTDPDGPGERIRARVSAAIPTCQHAFLSRSSARSQDGKRIGVEFASADDIREALREARVSTEGRPSEREFSLADMQSAGLIDDPQAALRRTIMGQLLRIGYANAKSFLRKLNALGVTRQEWEQAIGGLNGELQRRESEKGTKPNEQ